MITEQHLEDLKGQSPVGLSSNTFLCADCSITLEHNLSLIMTT